MYDWQPNTVVDATWRANLRYNSSTPLRHSELQKALGDRTIFYIETSIIEVATTSLADEVAVGEILYSFPQFWIIYYKDGWVRGVGKLWETTFTERRNDVRTYAAR